MTINEIAFDNFLQKLKGKIEKTDNTRIGGVYQILESSHFFYILTRGSGRGKSYMQGWGVTKNIIDELEGKAWFLIFLSEKPFLSFFLTNDNVNQSISSHKWSIANEKDYKIEEKDLTNYYTFRTIEEFKDIIFEEEVVAA
jgi:hypothetical protein